MRLAVTGGTGFVGSRLLDEAAATGHEIRALARRPQPGRPSVEWIQGSLGDRDSLAELVRGVDAVVHVAGVINASDSAGFAAGNIDGTLAMLAAATAAGVTRFVHVSSLAAREPKLSVYGESKRKAEELVQSSGLDWAIVRPPAVYGPGDRETLELFRMAAKGIVLMPPKGRISLLHADDLARLLLALSDPAAPRHLLVEADDGRPGGWSHKEFAAALATAVGRRGLSLSVPRPLLDFGAWCDRLVRRDGAKLTADRVSYFCHPDWVASPDRRPPTELWKPEIGTHVGLADTARWYREQEWL